MKRLLAFLMPLLLVVGCEIFQSAPEAMITFDPEQAGSFVISSEGDSFDVTFTSVMEWTAEIVYPDDSNGWANLNKASGDGGYDISRIKVSVERNTSEVSRSAKLLIMSDDVSKEIAFTQEAAKTKSEPVFKVLDGSAEISAEGGTVKVVVQYNVDYEVAIGVDWISEIVTRSYEEKVHTFEVAPNPETESRSTTISFCGNGVCVPFVVNQTGMIPRNILEVDVKDVTVKAEGTDLPIVVNVTSNLVWNVASDAIWCTVEPTSGENDGAFYIMVASNPEQEPRASFVTVSSADGSMTRVVQIAQAPAASKEGNDDWKEAEFIHRALFMRFTADWCGYCPMMATAIAKAQEMLPDKIEALSVHGGGSGLACRDSESLLSYYGVGSFPTGLVDGIWWIQNYPVSTTASLIVDAVNKTEEKYQTLTGVSWKSSVSGKQATLDISAYIKKSGSYKITALLVEDKVIGYQADYNGQSSNSYEHNGVIRAAFHDVLGESFDIIEDFQQKDFTYSIEVPSGCVVDNMRIVVFIQRKDGKYYVDNTASASVGKDRPLALISGNWGSGNEGIIPGDDITF